MRSHTSRPLGTAVVVAALVLAACGSDSDDATPTTADAATTAAPTTAAATTAAPTTAPATTAAPTTAAPTTAPTTTDDTPGVTASELAAPGPFEVGVTTRTLPSGQTAEIWYPADDSAAGATDAYSMRSFIPAAVADLVPPEIDATFVIDAARDGTPTDGAAPVVLFSHGAAAFRSQSSTLARHLASWGIAVASTDHASRYLENALLGTTEGQPAAADELRELRSFLEALPADDPLAGSLDMSRVALAGHSAGGGTIAEVATDPGILGYASYASGLGDSVPDVPSLFMAGELDEIVEPGRTQAAFEVAPAPSWLWVLAGAGHLAFSDLCAIGGDSTLIDLADAAGIGEFVDEGLRRLAVDGCEPPNLPVQDVWPAIDQASAGFFRFVFGVDAEPVGLDASAVTPNVVVTEK